MCVCVCVCAGFPSLNGVLSTAKTVVFVPISFSLAYIIRGEHMHAIFIETRYIIMVHVLEMLNNITVMLIVTTLVHVHVVIGTTDAASHDSSYVA